MTSKRRNFQKLNQIKRTSHAEKSDVLRDKIEGGERVVELELGK